MLGSIGPVEFTVSESEVKTFSDMDFTHKASFASHKILSRNELIEFTGIDASTCSLRITLSTDRGNDVQNDIDSLKEILTSHYAAPFTLGGNVMGSGLWVIENMTIGLEKVDSWGNILTANITLSLKESCD